MSRAGPDRTALLDALSAYVLQHGLNTASLRPLAAAAGTSDRMLIYHFGSKDGLITALLAHLAGQMKAGLTAALPPVGFAEEPAFLRAVVGLMRSGPFQPYVRLWFDIVSAAAQGQSAHRRAGQEIMASYLDWIAARHPDGAAAAPRFLALVEGILLLDAVGLTGLADRVLD
jgi:AcrR family transcriptional regulator